MDSSYRHPKGLYLLFATEMWERFSYYAMRGIFVLFLTKALLFDKAFASNLYGSFTGLVYLTPLIGGYIADRYWGNRRSILHGGLLMSVGQFCLFLSAFFYTQVELAKIFLYAGLLLLIIGNGFFKPNISTMVGQLYSENDVRKDSAYTIFYMGINVGALFSPLVAGTLGETGDPSDFKWGFLSACIGMLVSTVIFYILKNKYLINPDGNAIGIEPNISQESQRVIQKDHSPVLKKSLTEYILWSIGEIILFLIFFLGADFDFVGAAIFSLCIIVPAFIITDRSLTKTERKKVWVIYIIAFFSIFFFSAFEQAGVSLTFFADEQINRSVLGWEMPASYFQSINPLFIVILAPGFSLLWLFLNKKNIKLSSPAKQAIGLVLLSVGFLVISLGIKNIEPGMKISMFWLIALYFIITMGELCLSPIGLSLVNRLAPVRFASLLMGVWFLSSATANKFAGTLSALYPEFDNDGNVQKVSSLFGYQIDSLYDFFIIFVVMAGLASILLFFMTRRLEKMMGDEK
jgi:POT family proton-dependent oligopeptide transporter